MKNTQIVMASIVAVAVFSIAVAPITPSVFADPLGSNGENWGQATKFFAQIEPGNMGDHSSSFDNPRAGLGNLKNFFGGDWCLLLDFLNSLDDDAVLTCAEQMAD